MPRPAFVARPHVAIAFIPGSGCNATFPREREDVESEAPRGA